jgi:ribonuclease P protein component
VSWAVLPRLRRRKDVSHLFATGRRFRLAHCLLVVAPARDGTKKCLLVAGRRVGKAVHRSRARRRLRALAGQLAGKLAQPCWLGLVAHASLVQAPWGELVAEVEAALRAAGLLQARPNGGSR